MTKEQQRIAFAEAVGAIDRWVIMKRGLYYRPKANGYTDRIEEAWIVSEAEADDHVHPGDEPVTKRRAPLPDIDDLNVIHEAEKTLTDEQHRRFRTTLAEITSGRKDTGLRLMGRAEYRNWFSATAPQRLEAFLKTVGKWVEPSTKPHCPTCQGDGRSQNKMHSCAACHGEGKLWCAMCGSWGNHSSGQCPELAH